MSETTSYDFLRHELQDLRAQAGGNRRGAANADHLAAEMRRVADHLDQAISPLKNLLSPIRGLHTPSTWEGNAADASRDRLEDLVAQTAWATGSISSVADDLRAAASVQEVTADRLWGDYTAANRQIRGLEDLLGTGDPASLIR